MLTRFNAGLAAVAFSAAVFAGAQVQAGGDCCGGAGGQTADKPGEKKQQCSLSECDQKRTAATEAVLAKLSAPAPKLSTEDAKALADAQKQLCATCPFGSALTASVPAIVEALEAIHALDGALADGGSNLPADCKNAEGKCAFCMEFGSKMPKEAGEAMFVSMKSLDRAHKLSIKLAGIAATFKTDGAPTTKPAGAPNAVPSKETFAKLAKQVEAAAQAIAAGQAKAKALPEAEKAKLGELMGKIQKLSPGSFETMWGGYQALFAEVDLARMSLSVFENKSGVKDAKAIEALSPNAKNAYALFSGRAQLAYALAGVADAVCASGCDEGGCSGAPASEKKDAGCGGAAKEKATN